MTDSFSLIAVGDLQLGDSPTTVGYGFYSRYRGTEIDRLFDDVRPALSGGDILFANLETTLAAPGAGERGRAAVQLRGEPAFAAALRRVGFTVLNVANNHAVQHGDQTFHETVTTLRSAGIACCGIRGAAPWSSEPAMVCNGQVGFLGYCLRPRQYGAAVPPYAEGSRDEICADVRRLRESGVTVVVSLHWGEEFVPRPSRDEIVLGHAIIDAGASLILGHHPHVTRAAERYGAGVIVHSLGNFMGDMIWYAPFRRGAVFRCTIGPDGVTEASTAATYLRPDYRPALAPEAAVAPMAMDAGSGLDQASYDRGIAQTWRLQRAAAYRYAIVNVRRTPLPILAQLVADTARNKFAALSARVFGPRSQK